MKERILQAMREKGIFSMAELERKSGIPTGTMRNLGQGHMPSMAKLKKMSETLGVSVDWIVYGDKEEKEAPEKAETKMGPSGFRVPSSDPIREFAYLLSSLNDQNIQALIDYMRYLVSRQERD